MARAMKDSGIAWIGEIPEEWEVSRVGLHFDIILGKMLCSTQPSEDYTLEKYYCAANVHFDGVSNDDIKQMWFSASEKAQYAVKKGDLLVVEGGAGAGGCAIVKHLLDNMYIQNSIMIVRPRVNANNRYLRYLVECLVKMGYIDVVCNKATIPHFTKDKLANVPYLVNEKQKEIADFLDAECARIDAVIEQTRASIEEYKKLKQAVITQAVTKGIRPNRPMKSSGIDWIAQIPEEWSVLRGKWLFHETDERSEDGSEELLTVSHITGVTPRSQKNVNMFMSESLVGYKICRVKDIAANTMWMWQGAIGVSKYHGVISPSYNTYRQTNNHYDPDYLDYLLRIKPLVDTYNANSTGITASRLRLYPDRFLSIMLPIPPMEEQIEIAEYLNEKIGDVEKLIVKKGRYLSELENYKKSLVFEYVKGKKEVK